MAEQTIDMEALKSEIAAKGQEYLGKAAEFARERPHVAVGIAFGVGWLLGNGLSPKLLMGAARIGWRAVLGGALAGSGIAGVVSGAMGERPGGEPAGADSRAEHAAGGSGA
jgi:hypothetical protein